MLVLWFFVGFHPLLPLPPKSADAEHPPVIHGIVDTSEELAKAAAVIVAVEQSHYDNLEWLHEECNVMYGVGYW